MTLPRSPPECAQVAREIVTDWLGAFDPAPQIDFVQSEMLQAAIVSALRAAPSRFDAGSVTVTIFANGDNENTPAEAVHHALEYARKAGFIEAWSDPVSSADRGTP